MNASALIEKGIGKRWQKHGMDRIYINKETFAEIEHEEIPVKNYYNRYKWGELKVYFDLTTDELVITSGDDDAKEGQSSNRGTAGIRKENIMKNVKGTVAHPDWKHEGRSRYTKNGWTVWTTGFCWKIKNSDGYVYSAEYANSDTAFRFADKRMK